MRKPFLLYWLAFVLSFLFLTGAADAARLKVFFGQAGADFGRTDSYVEISPVLGSASRRCTQTCTVAVPNGTTITVKLSLTPAAEEFVGWVEPLPGQDLNKVCIGGTQPVCTFDTGQDTDYFAQPNVNVFTGTLQVNFGDGSFRKPVSAELDVQYLEISDAPVLTIPALSDGRTFSFLTGRWKVVAVRAADTECSLVGGAGFSGFTVAPSGVTAVTVPFKPFSCRVNAEISGGQGGSVSSSPSGISDCRTSCAGFFQSPSSVTFTAKPDSGFVFQRWSSGETTPSVSIPIARLAVMRTAFFVRTQGGGADLQITHTASSLTVAPGSPVTFTLTVSNNGPDAATNIAVSSPLPDDFTGVTITASQKAGECTPSGCNIGTLGSGSSATVTITATAPLALAQYTNTASVLSQDADPNPANNASKLTVTFGSTPPAPSSLSVVAGSNAPASRTLTKGTGINPALQVTLTPTGGPLTLEGLNLQATGTGDDANDLNSVVLIADTNANGALDTGETIVASGIFPTNDVTLTLRPSSLTTLSAPTTFLVAVSVNSSIAGMATKTGLALGIGALALICSRRRAFGVLGVGLALTLTACPNPPTPGTVIRTYQLSLSSVTANKAGVAITVSGLPITGATLSVEK